MLRVSSGILLWKKTEKEVKVFLVHPGGPFWVGKDEKAWDIPKGEVEEGEDLWSAALRELKEETGIDVSSRKKEEFISLGNIKRKDGKEVNIWAIKWDWSGLLMCRSWVEMEWPERSGKKIRFPEVDKAGFFMIQEARKKIYLSLTVFLERLEDKLKGIYR